MAERIFIAGTGRVGTGLALALADTEHEVVGLWNRSEPARRRAEELTGQEVASGPLHAVKSLREATVVISSVSDAAITPLGRELAGATLAETVVVAHTSGCATAAALERLDGYLRGSMHPLCACPTPVRAAKALRRCRYVIEGDEAARARLHALAGDLSGKSSDIAPDQKARYHAAAVMASNLVIALLDVAVSEMNAAGLPEMKNDLVQLAIGALEEAQSIDLPRALTGPVARGDSETIARHLSILDADTKEIYSVLSRRAVEIARGQGLDDSLVEAVALLLRSAR